MRFKDKRGQITIFIIMGVMLLLLISVYLYISNIEKAPKEEEIAPAIEEIPYQFQPIRSFVDSCLIKLSTESLKKIGETGGYINPDKNGFSANENNPTNSNSFYSRFGDKNSKVVYWHYFASDNNCRANCYCDSGAPTIDLIEKQVEKYISNNLRGCLQDFKSFKNQGFEITEKGRLKTDVSVLENDIAVSLDYPIKAKKEDAENNIDAFFIRIPLNLKRIIGVAEEITNSEIKYNLLERWTLEIINAYSLSPNENSLPPTAYSNFDPSKGPIYWSKSKAKDLIQNLLLPTNVPLFQVFNTDNYQDRKGSYYQRAILRIGSSYPLDGLKVNFEYLGYWEPYFDIGGRGVNGDKIGPESGFSSFFSWLGLQRYNYYYDLSYPVKIDIKDKNALNNKGYTFSFALESNIRDNKPLNCSANSVRAISPPSGSLICERQTWCANITIEVVDAKDENALGDVLISYGNGAEMCSIGTTKLEAYSGKAVLNEKLPQILGGSLTLSKNGYFSYPKIYSTRCNKVGGVCSDANVLCDDEILKVELEPFRIKNISVKKMKMLKSSGLWFFDGNAVPLLEDEEATITLTKIKENEFEENVVATALLDGSTNKVLLEPGIVPGTYAVRIDLFYNLPNKNRNEIRFKGATIAGQVIDDFVFNSTFMEGGANLNWTIDKALLDRYDNIEFYVISSPDVDNFDSLDYNDIGHFGNFDELSNLYRTEIEPKLS